VAQRLIASDLDGTLFGPNSVPEPRTVAAVNAAVDAGYVFAAVTGRSYFGGVDRVLDSGAKAHWFIGSNGGHRMELPTRILEERLLFSEHDVRTMVDQLAQQIDGIGFGFEHDAGFSFDAGFRAVFPNSFDGGQRQDTAAWATDNIGKIFVSHPTLESSDLIRAASLLVPDGTHVTTSGTSFVELTPPGGDKALGVARLCEKLGIAAADVVAFGDNNNDLSMLAWAGRGIAMANATSEALAIADEVTLSNTEYGVAVVLEELAQQ
jgi:Cof subfamily protein (haloacid dehalogenase superfamily)